ncbi:hypothetical protein [Micromonospora coxensis]|uniref:hypothetical protein n=1 Tax=Micromonospora coxensis TaxID=356852 RepID=UPI001E2B8A8D|nr:hypothetical protein [Micromonospora coxensis]
MEAAAMQHLRTTLRAALDHAVREGLLDCTPARHIEVNGYQQPHAKVWTETCVDQWEHDGGGRRWRSGPPSSSPPSSAT